MSWNSRAVRVDGRLYESIFSAAIDYEIDYSWLFTKLKKSKGHPVVVCGHTVELVDCAKKNME